MQFDLLRKSFKDVEDLINKRNQNINDFIVVIRELEKERTVLIEKCYRQYMSDIKQLSGESFEWLYEKYLKVNPRIILRLVLLKTCCSNDNWSYPLQELQRYQIGKLSDVRKSTI